MFWALGQLLRCKEEGEIPAFRGRTVYCGRQGGCGRGQDRYSGCDGEKPGLLWEPWKTLERKIVWGRKYRRRIQNGLSRSLTLRRMAQEGEGIRNIKNGNGGNKAVTVP